MSHQDIFKAIEAGDSKLSITLAESDSGLITRFNQDGWTPLHLASYFGDLDVVRCLLSRGADPNLRSQNDYNNTSLHAAAVNGKADVVE